MKIRKAKKAKAENFEERIEAAWSSFEEDLRRTWLKAYIEAHECEANKLLWKIKNALAKAVCKDLDRRILEDT